MRAKVITSFSSLRSGGSNYSPRCHLEISALSALAFLGCADSAENDGTQAIENDGAQAISCTASVKPATWNYVVENDVLTITTVTGETATVARIGEGNGIQGEWLLDSTTEPLFRTMVTVTSILRIENDRVTAIAECSTGDRETTVLASSAAEITDTSVTILEEDFNTLYY